MLLFGGVLAEVVDHADDIFRYEAADRAAGVHTHDDPAFRIEDEPGGLEVGRVGVDERAGRLRDVAVQLVSSDLGVSS